MIYPGDSPLPRWLKSKAGKSPWSDPCLHRASGRSLFLPSSAMIFHFIFYVLMNKMVSSPGTLLNSDGHSYQEAVSNAETIINEWIETAKELGREIPKPKGKLMYA